MAKLRYPREAKPDEWMHLAPLIRARRLPRYDLRIIFNTILFKLRNGCAWRRLPDDRPRWWTVYYYFRRWRKDGSWNQLISNLRQLRRPQPEDRGGRPRLPKEPKPSPQEKPSQSAKLDIVCWKRGWQWILGIELPEKLLESSDLELSQDGVCLSQDDSYEERWRLRQATGRVVVRQGNEVVSRIELATEDRNYLLFKLRGQNGDRGRRVKSLSHGFYLIVVPEHWERAGLAPVAPEPVSVEGYKAHFFDLDQGGGQKVAFRKADGELVRIESQAPRFQLIGNQLPDVSENGGPLFGGGPPKIRSLDGSGWNDIATIVIGEEGGGKGKWRTDFKPVPEVTEQELPTELLERKGGWYFIRLYDKQDNLLDSFDFRFLCALQDITIPQMSPLPSQDGHKPCRVEFLHELGCIIEPADGQGWDIQPDEGRTVVVVPPDATCDNTRWRVSSDGAPSIEVTIHVERVWWALGEEKTQPSNWGDQPLTLSRDDFRATSNKAVWLCLPRERWTETVWVGFTQQRSQRFSAKDRTVCIPLRGFGGSSELSTPGQPSLSLWLHHKGNSWDTTVAHVIIKAECRYCDFRADEEEEIVRHIECCHLGELFEPLTYEELRNHDPSLPHAIYSCSYCNHYEKSGGLRNPTTAIQSHIEKDCERARQSGNPVQIRFSVVRDVEEIRKRVISNLPRIHRCKLCAANLSEPTQASMAQHLHTSHGSALWHLR